MDLCPNTHVTSGTAQFTDAMTFFPVTLDFLYNCVFGVCNLVLCVLGIRHLCLQGLPVKLKGLNEMMGVAVPAVSGCCVLAFGFSNFLVSGNQSHDIFVNVVVSDILIFLASVFACVAWMHFIFHCFKHAAIVISWNFSAFAKLLVHVHRIIVCLYFVFGIIGFTLTIALDDASLLLIHYSLALLVVVYSVTAFSCIAYFLAINFWASEKEQDKKNQAYIFFKFSIIILLLLVALLGILIHEVIVAVRYDHQSFAEISLQEFGSFQFFPVLFSFVLLLLLCISLWIFMDGKTIP